MLVLEHILPTDVLTPSPASPVRKPKRPFSLLGLRRSALLAGFVALVLLVIAAHGRSTNYNNYVYLADAFLHGHVTIANWPGPNTVDAILFNGKPIVIEGPLPGLLMMPLVALHGYAANQTLLAIVLCTLAIAAAWELCCRLGCSRSTTIWLTAFFFAGTDMWWCAMLGDVWFIAHTAAVCATMFALLELTGKRRAWVIALLAAAALESRFTLLLALPLYAWMLFYNVPLGPPLVGPAEAPTPLANDRAALRTFVLTLVPVAALWLAYNELRWGSVEDLGYTLFYHQDSWGQPTGSPFALKYVPYQIYSFFLQSPQLVEWRQQALWPLFRPDVHGIALTFSSPALILAFLARAPRKLVTALWATVVLIAIPIFCYYLNGWVQFGMRHALDFVPFLFVLMIFAVRDRFPRWGIALCAYSIVIGTWGIWYWDAFVRTGN